MTFGPFAFLWALSILVHINRFPRYIGTAGAALLAFVAWLVLCRPEDRRRLLLLAATQIAVATYEAPFSVNHWMLMTMCHGVIFISVAARRRLDTFETYAPLLRVIWLVVWSYAVLAKLNHAYFDPRLSCATLLYASVSAKTVVFPALTGTGAIALSVLVEAAILLGLTFRRTRVFAVILAGLFHAFVTIPGFHAFSALATAFYVLFLPGSILNDVRERAARFMRGRAIERTHLIAIGAAGVLVWWFVVPTSAALTRAVTLAVRFGWFALQLWLTYLVFDAWRRHRPTPVVLVPRAAAQGALWLLVLPFVLNGAAPYLGIKTENSYTMFSNLQTEKGRWNHLFMPESTRVFGELNALVTVEESSSPTLQHLSSSQVQLTQRGLRAFVRKHRVGRLRWTENGQTHSARDDAFSDSRLQLGFWSYKWLTDRTVPMRSENHCQH